MTIEELDTYVWERLPIVNRTVLGRRVCSRVVKRAVRSWPVPVLEQCDDAQARVVGKYMGRSLERQVRHEYGIGILGMLVLGAIVQEVMRVLVQWWLDRQDNRAAMRLLVARTAHDD